MIVVVRLSRFWDDHLTCVKCRIAAGICTLDVNNPYSICESWPTSTWGKLRKFLRDAKQNAVKRGTQHWTCNVPTLLTWMDSASAISEFISVHQGQVEETSPILDACQAATMDNLVPSLQCVTLLTSVHMPPLGSTSNTLLLAHSTSVHPLLVTGPSFPPETQAPISMLPVAPIMFSGVPGVPGAPYSTTH